MKEKPKKQFTELSDQELEKVTGGTGLRIADPSQGLCVDKAQLPGGKCGLVHSIEKGDQCCMEEMGERIFAGVEPLGQGL